MSTLFLLKDICASCCECRSQKKKREFRTQLYAFIVEADNEIRNRVDTGVFPYSQLELSARLCDRLRLLCAICKCEDGNSEVCQEVETVLKAFREALDQELDSKSREKKVIEFRPSNDKEKIVRINFRKGRS